MCRPAILTDASQVAQQELSITREDKTERGKETWRARRQRTRECDRGHERWERKNNAEVRMKGKGSGEESCSRTRKTENLIIDMSSLAARVCVCA